MRDSRDARRASVASFSARSRSISLVFRASSVIRSRFSRSSHALVTPVAISAMESASRKDHLKVGQYSACSNSVGPRPAMRQPTAVASTTAESLINQRNGRL